MKLEKVVENHKPIQKIDIDTDKIFRLLKEYDENGIWNHH